MEIKSDFQISLDKSKLIRNQGKRFQRLLERPKIAIAFDEAFDQIHKISQPQVGWQRYKVKGILHDQLVLENEVKLGGGPVVDVMAAEALMINTSKPCFLDPADGDLPHAFDTLMCSN